jgi:hypothetical protein
VLHLPNSQLLVGLELALSHFLMEVIPTIKMTIKNIPSGTIKGLCRMPSM